MWAQALGAPLTSLTVLSRLPSFSFHFLLFFLAPMVLFATAVLNVTCTIPCIADRALEESACTRDFIFAHPIPSFLHDEPTQPTTCTYISPSHRFPPSRQL